MHPSHPLAQAARIGLSQVVAERLIAYSKGDFGIVLGTTVYGMRVSTPRDF